MLNTLLKLTRPLTVIDVETTGTNTDLDRIVQIGATVHYPDKDPFTGVTLINPGIHIPEEATATHHITDDMVKDAPTFREFAPKMTRILTGVDFAGHGVEFDLKILRAEHKRVGLDWDWESDAKVIDTLRIKQVLSPRDLGSLYEEATGTKLENAHDAGADVRATEVVLAWQLTSSEIPRTVSDLATFCWPKRPGYVDKSGKLVWRGSEACIGFGKKFNGTPLRMVERGYLEWILKNDFPSDTKNIVTAALAGRFPKKES